MVRIFFVLVVIVGWGRSTASAAAAEPAPAASGTPARQEWIAVSADKTHFVRRPSNERFIVWGFNYDRDDSGRLIEDYWADEWQTVVEDFREMKDLGANVVRVHLQVGRFLKAANQPDDENLAKLAKLVRLAEQTGVYLDVTGLGCYHKKDVPIWYAALSEADRWDAQAVFWKAVAGVCKDSPAIFCYDLMNEPVSGGGGDKSDWLPGEPLGGKHFVQRLTLDPGKRTNQQIAKAWVAKLTSAIREVDPKHMITVGVIPWAQIFKGAKPLFYDPEVGGPLDFTSVHFYPKTAQLAESVDILKVYEVGKPLVIEEIFPMGAGAAETIDFIQKSSTFTDGWISFYWGKTIEQNRQKKDLPGALIADWLERFSKLAREAAQSPPRSPDR